MDTPTTEYSTEKSFAAKLDVQDPLKKFRDRFYIPQTPAGEDTVYLSGNSLGLQPRSAKDYILQELNDWAKFGVEGHFHAKNPWMPYHEFLAKPMANIVGASEKEVVVMNSLTLNLHLMMVSFYRPTPERFKIIIEKDAFPSDRYAAISQIRFHGYDPETALIELGSEHENPVTPPEAILRIIEEEGDSVALIMLAGVNYYTGQVFPLKDICKKGHKKGCLVGYDLAHGAGNIELKLHDWNVDFAVWCSYKYMNAGPGGVGGAFVHERHHRNFDLPRFAGWWGHDKASRFKMPADFNPEPGAEGWQLSNAPVLSMATFRASLEIFEEVGMEALHKKSRLLTGYLEFLIRSECVETIEIITPADPDQRGCQLSLRAPGRGKEVFDKLLENGVHCDWREPDVIRVAPVPLYNSFMDAWSFVEILKSALN